MPVRTEKWPAGTPCWVDLAVPDIEAAKAFYGAVIGWEFDERGAEYGGYVNCHRGGALAAGLSPQYQAGVPVGWTVYFATEDIATTAQRIGDAGGSVAFGPLEVMDLGTMALAADPGGAAFGIWQSGAHTGFGLYREPGAVIWEELVPGTGGAAAARDFYGSVFDLSFTGMDGGYAFTPAGALDNESVGSVGDPTAEDAGPHWQLWFLVPDVDAAAAAAAAHGGKVVSVPHASQWGRQARLLDPAGAELWVMSAPAA